MAGFIQTNFIEVVNKVQDSSENSLTKPTLMFKLQKGSPKLKTLQGSVTRIFSNLEQQLPKTKNKLSNLILIEEYENHKLTDKSDEDNDLKVFYTEPSWSGMPEDIYKMEILKSGTILKTLDLSSKNYHVIGKSLSCDISVTHETISQFHAILQFRKISDSENEKGIYIYDLESTNGTFLNGNRIKPNTYILLRGGYSISFGGSQRKYILQTPRDNEEKEAELSVTELNELKRLEAEEEKKLENERLLKEEEERLNRENELKGVNWGIAEDINENSRSTEISENLESDNEELFLDDPKKALRDWFKWEGYDLEYKTEDRGFGLFSCSINLTLDALGNTETVEAHVVGDKMKAIDECALKACILLNKYRRLQQAHEEKKSTSKNWEEVDYYDSDEDNFLDRTGIVEKKRQQRMQMAGKIDAQSGTYNSLHEKHSKILERIKILENLLASQNNKQNVGENADEDALDAFMSNLETSILSKTQIRDIKMELHNLHQEEIQVSNSKSFNKDPSTLCPADIITEKTKNGYRFNIDN